MERNNLNGPIKGSPEWIKKLYDEFHKHKNFIYVSVSFFIILLCIVVINLDDYVR